MKAPYAHNSSAMPKYCIISWFYVENSQQYSIHIFLLFIQLKFIVLGDLWFVEKYCSKCDEVLLTAGLDYLTLPKIESPFALNSRMSAREEHTLEGLCKVCS